MAWIFSTLLLITGCSFVASELSHGCIRPGNYMTTTFWCPDTKRIFILESYRGCSDGDTTSRCENRTADHHTCKENRELLTDVFRKSCNNKQLCNFNEFLQNVQFQGNLRFYVWFTCTTVLPTAQTLELTRTSDSANNAQIIIKSTNYPAEFMEARSFDFDLPVPDGITVSLEIKELLEESGGENVCLKVLNYLFRKSICSERGGSFSTLFLPSGANTLKFGPISGTGRVMYYIILTAMEGNRISSTSMQLTYTVAPPPQPDDFKQPEIPTPRPAVPAPQPAIPTPQPAVPPPPQQTPAPHLPYPPPADQQVTTPKQHGVLPQTSENSNEGLNLPILLGGIAGGILAFVALIILAVFLVARKRSDHSKEDTMANKSKGSSIEYYSTSERVKDVSTPKNLNVCEYYQVSHQTHPAGANVCYYEETPPSTAIRPPTNENQYFDLKVPALHGQNREVVNGAIYSMPNKDEMESGARRPYVPQGAIKVF